MSQKALSEAKKWLSKGIISEDQFELIQAEYPARSDFLSLLPFFSSLLIGLGALSWVAFQFINGISNQDFIAMLILVVLFFGVGEYFKRNNQNHAYIGMQVLGLLSSGGVLFIAQGLFYPEFTHVIPLFLWSLLAISLTWLRKSDILHLMSIFISLLSVTFTNEDWLYLFISILIYVTAIMTYPLYIKKSWLTWFSAAGCLIFFLRLQDFVGQDLVYWLFLIPAALYASSYVIPEFAKKAYSVIGLYSMLVMGIFASTLNWQVKFWDHFGWGQSLFLSIYLMIFLGMFLSAKCICHARNATFDGLVMIPWFVWLPEVNGDHSYDILIILMYAAHGLLTMYRGNVNKIKSQVTVGIVQFLGMVLILFIQLDWNWDMKFLVFLGSGLVLFVLNLILKRK